MNVLFLSISSMGHMSSHSISLDLLHEFKRAGHSVYTVSALPKGNEDGTNVKVEDGITALRVKIGKNKKANVIVKGLTTVLMPGKYIKAIKRHFGDIRFDLVLYPTPPVTLANVVKFIKKRDNAKSYLLLKDIFPQNAVDIGMMKKTGVKGILYRYFRKKEKKLYALSDYIGCMSEANVEYVLRHNPEVPRDIVEVCPNAIEVCDASTDAIGRAAMREKYGIPHDKRVFVYGGNLGRPQGIPYLMKCLLASRDIEDAFFLIVGDGTEYKKLEAFLRANELPNVKLMKRLPKEDYDRLVGACDVGMIFLDHRFTIPNFPSRLLAYMQAKLPVLAVTDPNTDVGEVCVRGGFGTWCEANDTDLFVRSVRDMLTSDLIAMGEHGFEYLSENYTARHEYDIIMARVGEKETVTV